MPSSLTIVRRPQLAALAAVSMDAFYQRLADHVVRVFPTHASMVRGERGRAFMETCVDRARVYGLREGRAIALFTDLILALGTKFDEDPRHEWIREILTSGLGDTSRMYLIYKDLPRECPGPPVPPEFWTDDESDTPRASRRVPVLVRCRQY